MFVSEIHGHRGQHNVMLLSFVENRTKSTPIVAMSLFLGTVFWPRTLFFPIPRVVFFLYDIAPGTAKLSGAPMPCSYSAHLPRPAKCKGSARRSKNRQRRRLSVGPVFGRDWRKENQGPLCNKQIVGLRLGVGSFLTVFWQVTINPCDFAEWFVLPIVNVSSSE